VRIALAKDDSQRPRTRRELLSHVWAHTDLRDTDVFKEGPFYAARKGRVIAATHSRTIDSRTFAEWVKFLRDIPERT
jgi:hypothetical protein